MKTLIVLIAIAISVMAFTWEGELDPNEFDKWELAYAMPQSNGVSWYVVKNPDKSELIDTVALLVDLNANLLGYRYFIGNEPHGYFFDLDEEKYKRHKYTQEQKQACMECHSGKVELGVKL